MPQARPTLRDSLDLPARLARGAVVALCATLLAACSAFQTERPPEKAIVVNTSIDDAPRTYLETMNALASSDPARQADIFYEIEREHTRAPTTTNTLRYAAALVTPGHPAAKLSEGKKLLETLLATPERMSASERTLAQVLLYETNEHLRLIAENRHLLETIDSRNRSLGASERRAQAQAEEAAHLRRSLAEAQQKLDAVKEIEKSIIERTPATPAAREPPPREK